MSDARLWLGILLVLLAVHGGAAVDRAAEWTVERFDAFVGAVARRVWGDLDGAAVREHARRARRETGL